MLYRVDRAIISEYYHLEEVREGLSWLIGHKVLYVERLANDTLRWVFDTDALNNAGQSPPLAEIITRRILAEAENKRIKPVRTE